MALFRLIARTLGSLCSFFLMTLLLFLFLTNIGILRMMGLKTYNFKSQDPSQGDLNIFN
jgi:hypothetical protein